jgi:hypothetical protein
VSLIKLKSTVDTISPPTVLILILPDVLIVGTKVKISLVFVLIVVGLSFNVTIVFPNKAVPEIVITGIVPDVVAVNGVILRIVGSLQIIVDCDVFKLFCSVVDFGFWLFVTVPLSNNKTSRSLML